MGPHHGRDHRREGDGSAQDIAGKLTLTIDPKFACQIRGVATDENGNRIWGPSQALVGTAIHELRDEAEPKSAIVLQSYVTNDNGWFVFRGLWPGFAYSAEVEAVGRPNPLSQAVQ